MKKKIGSLILEIIPVMIGVFLGFAISNWAENARTNSQVGLFKKNIIAEIHANKERIESVTEYHRLLGDSSGYYAMAKNLQFMSRFFKGTRSPVLVRSAFETGVQTGLINGLVFNDIQEVNYVYSLQDKYTDMNALLLNGLINISMGGNDDEQSIRKVMKFLNMSMNDINYLESDLIQQYDHLLAILEGRKSASKNK